MAIAYQLVHQSGTPLFSNTASAPSSIYYPSPERRHHEDGGIQ